MSEVRIESQRQECIVYQRMEKQEKGSMDGKCNTETTERNNVVQMQAKREDSEK